MRRLFDNLLRVFRPSIVCDVGAFNGEESLRFAETLPTAHIVAFEASEKNIAAYWRGNPRFEPYPQIHYELLAVSDRTGTTSFQILDDTDDPEKWRIAAGSLRERVVELPHQKVDVQATTLDDYFEPVLALNTFALWIDVEGALDQVLNGAKSLLRRTMFFRAEVEHSPFWRDEVLADEIKRQIEAAGFSCIGDTHVPGGYEQSDVLFVRDHVLDLMPRLFPLLDEDNPTVALTAEIAQA